MNRLHLFLGITLSLQLIATAQNTSISSDPRTLAQSYNGFGFNVFAKLLKAKPECNVVMSPASLAFGLAMVEHGAAGKTHEEMVRSLELGAITNVPLANKNLLQQLTSTDPNIQLDIANSIWLTHARHTKPEFIERSRTFYQAEVKKVDFTAPGIANEINAWANENTHGKITQVVQPPLDPAIHALLLNATYFKGTWTRTFKDARTKSFFLPNGTAIQHPIMPRSGYFDYIEEAEFQGVELPYGKNEAASMYVFLPSPGSSLTEFLQHLNATNWTRWTTHFEFCEGAVELPRFKLKQQHQLNQALQAVGLSTAFSARADFTPIAEELYIDTVQQDTAIEVNEQGTEAAAVTGVCVMTASVGPEPKPFRMVVDRPFFFAIRENKTGAILFMGAIFDPR